MAQGSSYRIIIDGQEFYDIPSDLDNFKLELKRDGYLMATDNVFRVLAKPSLTFWGDIYCYLCNVRKEGICKQHLINISEKCGIYADYVSIFDGVIKQKNITINTKLRTASASIFDNSYSQQIKDNEDTKVILNKTTTKGGFPITPCKWYYIDTFIPAGAYQNSNNTIKAYDLFDSLRFIIDYITDNSVPIISDYFTGAEYERYCIVTATEFWNGNIPSTGILNKTPFGYNQVTGITTSGEQYKYPQLTFKEWLSEVRKKLRIYIGIEYDNLGSPILRIEPEAYYYSNIIGTQIDNEPIEIIETFDSDNFFNELSVGDSNAIGMEYFVYTKGGGHRIETYRNCDACDVKNNIDLKSNWIIDSNYIHSFQAEPFSNAQEVTDGDKIIMLELELPHTIQPYKIRQTQNLINTDKYHFNESLKNSTIVSRWIDNTTCDNGGEFCLQACNPDENGSYYIDNWCEIFQWYDLKCDTSSLVADVGPNIIKIKPETITSAQIDAGGKYIIFPNNGSVTVNLNITFEVGNYFLVPLYTSNFDFFVRIAQYDSSAIGGYGAPYLTYDTPLINYLTNPATPDSVTVNVTNTVTINFNAGDMLAFFVYTQYPQAPFLTDNDNRPNILDTTASCITLTNYVSDAPNLESENLPYLPYKYEFELDCLNGTSFKNIVQNKNKMIKVADMVGYIKSIEYSLNGTHKVTMMSDKTLCECKPNNYN